MRFLHFSIRKRTLPFSIKFRAGRNVRIDHKEIEPFVSVFFVHCGDKHTFRVNPHHLSRRQVDDCDASLADKLFGLVILMYAAQNHAIFALAVVKSEFEQFWTWQPPRTQALSPRGNRTWQTFQNPPYP